MAGRPDFDDRYAEPVWAYGTEPNDFLREAAGRLRPGPVLCLGEGQGRNAVHLAVLGFPVVAMDRSGVGLARARELARSRGVTLETVQADLDGFDLGQGRWAGIVSIFCHLPRALRRQVHGRVPAALAPGGALILEAYAPGQLGRGTGGPQDPDLLPPLAELAADLAGLRLEVARELDRDVREGPYHQGLGSVVQVLARRPAAEEE